MFTYIIGIVRNELNMHSIRVSIEAITEFHEPNPYTFYPSLKVDVYEIAGNPQGTATLLAHRCEDIKGLPSSTDKGVALISAREYLDDNYKPLVQAIISKIGE